MQIRWDDEPFDFDRTVAALGTFDGVHLGHRTLITRAIELARELDAQCIVCTFDRHPLSVLCPERTPKQLMTLEEKLATFEALGADGALVRRFTPEFAAVDAERFLEDLVRRRNAVGIVAGFNYSFGAYGRGDAAMILDRADALGYRAEIIPEVRDGGDTVSSTLIRRLINDGQGARAEHLLGREAR